MSRYISEVPAAEAAEVFGLALRKSDQCLIELGHKATVTVAHGFDLLNFYFCDLVSPTEHAREEEEPIGIFYGDDWGLTKRVGRWEYQEAMVKLGLLNAAHAVTWDIPY